MSSYFNVFGGNVVGVAPDSFTAINLTGNITLSWPTEFQNVNQVVAQIINVTESAGGFTITMPDARNVSVGQAIIINNVGAHTFTLNKNDGVALINTVAIGSSTYIFISDNTTQGGTWYNIPFGQGATAVTSVAAVSNTTGITITGSPIVNAGTFTFDLGGDLLPLNSLGASTGFAVRLTGGGAPTWTTRSIVGSSNIQVTNGTGLLGNTQVTLSSNITGITQIQIGNVQIAGNTISTTNANGNLILAPNGTGEVQSNNNINLQSDSLLKFYNTANTFYTSFKSSPLSLATTDYTLPIAYPAVNNYGLVSTTGGVTSWAQIATGNVPGENRITNGDFNIWTRYAGSAGATGYITNQAVYCADRWQINIGAATTLNASRTLLNGGSAISIQRQLANNGTNLVTLATSLTSNSCEGLQSNITALSFNLFPTSGFSAASITVTVVSGNGATNVSNLTTGFTGATTIFSQVITPVLNTTTYYTYQIPASAANMTQLAVSFAYSYVGAAGADDTLIVQNVQLELSNTSTPFQKLAFRENFLNCQFFYRKSFLYGTIPAQNIGLHLSEEVFTLAKAGAAASVCPTIYWGTVMRTNTGTLTTYNPTAANNKIANVPGGAAQDQTPSAQYIYDRGFYLTLPGIAGGAAGDQMAYNWTYENELF